MGLTPWGVDSPQLLSKSPCLLSFHPVRETRDPQEGGMREWAPGCQALCCRLQTRRSMSNLSFFLPLVFLEHLLKY